MGKFNLETPEKAVKDIRRHGSSQEDMESSQNIWLDKETYKKFGFDEMNKFNQMEKEMGAVVSYSEGEASGEISKIFDKSIFEEK